jgi:hypothetical protein
MSAQSFFSACHALKCYALCIFKWLCSNTYLTVVNWPLPTAGICWPSEWKCYHHQQAVGPPNFLLTRNQPMLMTATAEGGGCSRADPPTIHHTYYMLGTTQVRSIICENHLFLIFFFTNFSNSTFDHHHQHSSTIIIVSSSHWNFWRRKLSGAEEKSAKLCFYICFCGVHYFPYSTIIFIFPIFKSIYCIIHTVPRWIPWCCCWKNYFSLMHYFSLTRIYHPIFGAHSFRHWPPAAELGLN